MVSLTVRFHYRTFNTRVKPVGKGDVSMSKRKLLLVFTCIIGLVGCTPNPETKESQESVEEQQFSQVGNETYIDGKYITTIMDKESGIEYILVRSRDGTGVSITPRLEKPE